MRVLAGKESVDIGLLVKNARGPVCVPDYARPVPEGSGWQYSPALVGVLTQYKVPAQPAKADWPEARLLWPALPMRYHALQNRLRASSLTLCLLEAARTYVTLKFCRSVKPRRLGLTAHLAAVP